jgi:hypothetical protein
VGGPCAGIILLTFPTPKLGGQRPERSRDSGAEKKLSRCAPCWVHEILRRALTTGRVAGIWRPLRSAGWGSVPPLLTAGACSKYFTRPTTGCRTRAWEDDGRNSVPTGFLLSRTQYRSLPTTRPCCRAPFLLNKPPCGSKEDSCGALPDWRDVGEIGGAHEAGEARVGVGARDRGEADSRFRWGK